MAPIPGNVPNETVLACDSEHHEFNLAIKVRPTMNWHGPRIAIPARKKRVKKAVAEVTQIVNQDKMKPSVERRDK
jgi:hypothetical protein